MGIGCCRKASDNVNLIIKGEWTKPVLYFFIITWREFKQLLTIRNIDVGPTPLKLKKQTVWNKISFYMVQVSVIYYSVHEPGRRKQNWLQINPFDRNVHLLIYVATSFYISIPKKRVAFCLYVSIVKKCNFQSPINVCR